MSEAAQLANLAPPFAEGNTAAVTHGIYSEEGRAAVEALVAPYVEAVVARAPWVASEAFAAELRAWAYAEAEAEAWRQHLSQVGFADGKGKVRPACEALHRAEIRAGKLRSNLGLSPMAHARLIGVMQVPTIPSISGVPRTPEMEAVLDKVLQQVDSEGRRLWESVRG